MNQSLKCAVIVAVVALASVSRAAAVQITDESGAAGGFGSTGTEFGPIDDVSFSAGAAASAYDGPAPFVDLPYPRGDGSSLGTFSLDGKVFRGLDAPSSAASFSDPAGDRFGADLFRGDDGSASALAAGARDPLDLSGAFDAPSPAASAPADDSLFADAGAPFAPGAAADGGSPFGFPEVTEAAAAADDKRFLSLATDGADRATADAFAGVVPGGSAFDTQALDDGSSAFAAGAPAHDDAGRILSLATDGAQGDAFDAPAPSDDLAFAAGSQDNLLAGFGESSPAASGIEDHSGVSDAAALDEMAGELSSFPLGDPAPSAASAIPDDGALFSDPLGSATADDRGFEGLNDGFDAAGLGASASPSRPAFTKRGVVAAAREIGSDVRQATGDVADEIRDGAVTVGDDIRGAMREVSSDIRQASSDVADEFRDGVATVRGDVRAHFGHAHRYRKRGVVSSAVNLGGRIGRGAKYGWNYAGERLSRLSKYAGGKLNTASNYAGGKLNTASNYAGAKLNRVSDFAGQQAGKVSTSVKNNRWFVKPITRDGKPVMHNGEVVKTARKLPLVAAGVGLGAGTVYLGSKFTNDDRVSAEDDEHFPTAAGSSEHDATSGSDSEEAFEAASTTTAEFASTTAPEFA